MQVHSVPCVRRIVRLQSPARGFPSYVQQKLWQELRFCPEQWEDMRPYKQQTGKLTMPDFRQPTSGERIWIPDNIEFMPPCESMETIINLHQLNFGIWWEGK